MADEPITWPTPEDLWKDFAAAGLMTNPPTGALLAYDWQDAIDSAVGEWEEKCGIRPFLAVAGTRDFATPDLSDVTSDPWGRPSRIVSLPGGFTSVSQVRVLTSALFGAVPGMTDPDAGIVLVEGQDYILLPVGAPGKGKPYTGIAFTWGHHWAAGLSGGESGIIRVTGKFGYAESLPREVRKLVKDLALCDTAPIVHSANFTAAGGVVGQKRTVTIGPSTVSVGAGGGGSGTSPVLFGDEEQKARIRRKMVVLAADYEEPVMA